MYLLGVKQILSHTHKTRFWYLLGIFLISDKHHHQIYIWESPPPPPLPPGRNKDHNLPNYQCYTLNKNIICNTPQGKKKTIKHVQLLLHYTIQHLYQLINQFQWFVKVVLRPKTTKKIILFFFGFQNMLTED